MQEHPERFRATSLISLIHTMGSVHPDIMNEILERQDRVAKIFKAEEAFKLMTFILCFSAPPPSPGEPSITFPPELLAVRNRFVRALESRASVPAEEILRAVNDAERLVDLMRIAVGGNIG